MVSAPSPSPSVGRATTALATSSPRAAHAAVSVVRPSILRQKVPSGLVSRIVVAVRRRPLVLGATIPRLKATCPSDGRQRGPTIGVSLVVAGLLRAVRSVVTTPRSMLAVFADANPATTSSSSSATPVPLLA